VLLARFLLNVVVDGRLNLMVLSIPVVLYSKSDQLKRYSLIAAFLTFGCGGELGLRGFRAARLCSFPAAPQGFDGPLEAISSSPGPL